MLDLSGCQKRACRNERRASGTRTNPGTSTAEEGGTDAKALQLLDWRWLVLQGTKIDDKDANWSEGRLRRDSTLLGAEMFQESGTTSGRALSTAHAPPAPTAVRLMT